MQNSKISWTDHTWNIARGCTKVDKDCLFCYMMRDGDRYKYDGKVVERTKTVFKMPLRIKDLKSNVWPGPPLVFTSSLTDFFHEDIDSYRHEAWEIIRQQTHLIFQILTKRPERIKECLPKDWGNGWDNVWLGTSVGSANSFHRIWHLSEVRAKIHFLSFEPMWGELHEWLGEMGAANIQWVIIGGESGNETGKWRYRPAKLEWFERVVQDCQAFEIPVFVKQLGTHLSKELGLKDRHGADIAEWPQNLRVQQFPT